MTLQNNENNTILRNQINNCFLDHTVTLFLQVKLSSLCVPPKTHDKVRNTYQDTLPFTFSPNSFCGEFFEKNFLQYLMRKT
jgi:hypothetical protein